jgi:hypothetical protein
MTLDLGPTLERDRNDIVVRVDGRARDFDIDIYEGGDVRSAAVSDSRH